MGYDNYAGWGEETVWATEVARTQFARVYEESSAAHEIPRRPVEFLAERDPDMRFDGIQRGVVSLALPMVYAGLGKLLKHSFGVVVDAGVGPYTHTFTVDKTPYTRTSPAPLVGLSTELHMGMPDVGFESWTLEGGRVRNFSAAFAAGEETRFRAELVGKQVKQDAKTVSPTFPAYAAASSPLVIPAQITIEFDDVGSTRVRGVEITVNNNLRDDDGFLGSLYIDKPTVRGRREITGTISKEWENKTLYDKFISGAVAKLEVICTGPGNFLHTWLLAQIRFTGETPGLAPTEAIDQNLPFTAYHDATNTAIKLTEQNDTATT